MSKARPNEGKAFQAMLVRSLKFCDMAAVVQQENSPTSSLLRMSKWGCYCSALGVTFAWVSTNKFFYIFIWVAAAQWRPFLFVF
jgi:hypothetical protein